MKLGDLIRNLDIIDCSADLSCEVTDICYDSRLTRPGNLFVAIRGFETDGHRYIPGAITKGAVAVICEQIPAEGTPYIQVADSRLALALVSRDYFGNPASEMTLVGFTGTSGKTSSTLLLKHVLETQLNAKVGLIGTNGNAIGELELPTERTTPESYELQKLFRRMRDEGCSHVVMEVSSHSLTLERVGGIIFDTALFTNLSQDHLDLHGTMKAYAEAKRSLFSQSRLAWVNSDDVWAPFMTEGANCGIERFAVEDPEADLRAEKISLHADGVSFTAVYKGERTEIHLNIPGLFSVYNALGVTAAALSLGITLDACSKGLSTAESVKGRMETLKTDSDFRVIIDYSHKPDALEKALKTLRPLTKGRLIVLFGCGGDRDQLKRPIMGRVAAENADLVIVTSDNPRTEEPETIINQIVAGIPADCHNYEVICDRRTAIGWAIDNAAPGDVILLAGKGHETYQEIGHTKLHMDEREIVAEFLRNRKCV